MKDSAIKNLSVLDIEPTISSAVNVIDAAVEILDAETGTMIRAGYKPSATLELLMRYLPDTRNELIGLIG